MIGYQAIITKFLPATNKLGSRVKASAPAGSIILGWDHGLNIEKNHARAAEALARKLGWTGQYFMGGMDKGFCFVAANDSLDCAFKIS